MTARDELLDAALDLIAPKPGERGGCRQQIIYCARIGPQLVAAREDPTPGAWREEISAYGTAVRRFLAATNALSRRSEAVLFNHLEKGNPSGLTEALQAIAVRAEQLAYGGGIPTKAKGNKPTDPVLIAAASWSLRLLTNFSEKRPSTTSDGPYQHLTRLLYEYVSGRTPDSVERACDHELKKFQKSRDKQLAK